MSQGSPYQYTAADIRRYVEGKMNPAEMHAIEMAALEDPFLADAIEGYQSTRPTEADVDALKKRLADRISPAKVVPMKPSPKPWLSMAAAIVVLAGMAFALWMTMDAPPQPAIAKLETRDTVIEEINITDSVVEPEVPGPPVAATEKAKKAKPGSTPVPQPQAPVTAAPAGEPPVVTGYTTKPAEKTADEEVKVSELVTARDESAKRLRSAPVAAPKAAQADKAKQNETGARIYTEPADGWSAFEVYLLNNIRRPKDPVLHGNVVLSFQVDPDTGKPFDIKVDKSLHPLYDKEAVRLLKEGPGWAVYNTEKAVKTTYTVVF